MTLFYLALTTFTTWLLFMYFIPQRLPALKTAVAHLKHSRHFLQIQSSGGGRILKLTNTYSMKSPIPPEMIKIICNNNSDGSVYLYSSRLMPEKKDVLQISIYQCMLSPRLSYYFLWGTKLSKEMFITSSNLKVHLNLNKGQDQCLENSVLYQD